MSSFEVKDLEISVVMASYNGNKYIRRQLDSILFAQELPVSELIIIDDCSTDSTIDILNEYVQLDSRIKLFRNYANLGLVKSFELGLLQCNGDFIFLSDQDDIWYPKKTGKMLIEIGSNLLLHSDANLIDEQDNIYVHSFSTSAKNLHLNKFTDLLIGNIVTGCTCLCRRELIELSLPFPDGVQMHDQYLAQIASFYKRITYLDLALTGYRQHDNNVFGANGTTYEQLYNYHVRQLAQVRSLYTTKILAGNYDVAMSIQYHESILNSSIPSLRLLYWCFLTFGSKRTLGFILRGSCGRKVAELFYRHKREILL